MIALHAAFDTDRLLVWAEPESGKRTLLESISCVGTGFKYPKGAARQAVGWLPSREGIPAPSSPMLGATLSGSCRLERVSLTVAPLDSRHAINFLAAISEKRVLAPGVLVGDDLSYWTAALRFAAGLTMRGQYLPSIKREGSRWLALWMPVFYGYDAARLRSLARAMPPSARAITLEDKGAPPEGATEEILTAFIGAVIDRLVRSSKSIKPPSPIESAHDCWLHALTTDDPVIHAAHAAAPGLRALTEQVAQWQRPIHVSSRAPFRLSFRIEEPEHDEERWRVRYLLQGTKDPSLILPAADVWKSNQLNLAQVADSAAIREHLLASLGQAAGICPRVEQSLNERAPEGYWTDASGAYEFLRTTAEALEMSGFGVILPAWWTRKGTATRLTTRARVKSGKAHGGSGLSLETLVTFDWELALGAEKISKAELAALARLKSPLVKLRGRWVEVNREQIKAALDYLKKNPTGQSTVRDIIRMAVGASEEAGPLEMAGVSAEGWIGELLAQIDDRSPFEQLPQPDRMKGTLRPYQLRGYSWLEFLKKLGLGACLADDMGLGKTVQTLALIQRERSLGEQRPVLLVCPTSVVGNWQKESARFAPELPVLVHHGGARNRSSDFGAVASSYAIVLSTYALLHRDIEVLGAVDWAGVILDEAQNIKNADTKQARAARSLQCGYRITLTGTPVENNVADLWSLMEFINPGFLGTFGTFKKRFFVPIQVYSDQAAADRLRRITGPFILRRLKTDKSIITDLPDKLEMKVFCNLTKEQASLYEAVVKDAEEAIEKAEGIERRGLVLATLMKLKQVCNHPAQFLKDNSAIEARSGKVARLVEMIEETLAVNDRSLIFTQFAEMGEILQRHLQETFGAEVLFLHGGTARKQRDLLVDRFSSEGGPRVFLLSLKAGGTGLNLTNANHVFHFDRWWNPAVENQATDRAFRIGQTKNVQVHKFVCAGTLEEKIDEMIERKKQVAGRVVGTGEGWLTELSNEELRNLFALRKEAVAG